MSKELNQDFDAFPDVDLSAVEDLEDFSPPPQGSYVATLQSGKKEINGVDYVEFRYTITEVVSLKNENDKEPEIGTTFSETFNLADSWGQKFFKAKAAIIAEALGIPLETKAVLQAMAEGIQVEFFHGHYKKKGADDKDVVYSSVPPKFFQVVV